jgi:tetratricopeptide (TPR) repeat protein
MRRNPPEVRELTLRSFWKTPPDLRDLALAYASLAPGEPQVRPVALSLLEKAARTGEPDSVLLAQLGEFYDRLGNPERAIQLYERSLRLDPLHPAAANLAIHRVSQGRPNEAISLWRDLFVRNPAMAGPGVNLALELFRSGDQAAAESSVLRVLRYHPDLEVARKLLDRIRAHRGGDGKIP